MEPFVIDPALVLPELVGEVGTENRDIDMGGDPGHEAGAANEHQPGEGREDGEEEPDGGPDSGKEQGKGQVADGHKEGVFEVLVEGAGELGLDREEVEQDHPAGDEEQGAAGQHDLTRSAAPGEAEVEVQPQDYPYGGSDEPVDGGLPEVFLEGAAEVPGGLPLVGTDALHHSVVEGGSGSADGNYRQAVDKPQEMEDHDVSDQVKGAPEGAFDRKQSGISFHPGRIMGGRREWWEYYLMYAIIKGKRAVVESKNPQKICGII